MAKHTTVEGVCLEFERTIPLLGRHCRTKSSQRGTPPYFDLVVEDGKRVEMVRVLEKGAVQQLTSLMSLREMASLLEGIRLADYVALPTAATSEDSA